MPDIQLPLQEPESFSNLFNHTHLTIFRYVYGLHGGPREEVEDLTSDTFTRAWKSRSKFSGDDHDALCWLFTIARNLVIDAHRKRKIHQNNPFERIDDTLFDDMFSSNTYSPEEQVSNREQFTHLWDILQNQPYERREMLVMRYMLNWQVKEIAEFLDMEDNTVSVYIRRTLEQIRLNW
jgi:RNA polymerase sigma-70 factor (ECF subfamily)